MERDTRRTCLVVGIFLVTLVGAIALAMTAAEVISDRSPTVLAVAGMIFFGRTDRA